MLALQKEANATVIFNHKLVSCDFEGKVASFERVLWKNESVDAVDKPAESVAGNGTTPLDNTKSTIVEFDFVIGCDGSYSVLRQCMMRQSEMDFQQSYIDALWCDFIIPPASDGQYRMDSKCLHVWPDKESIVMAQPDFVSHSRPRTSQYVQYYQI